MVANLTGHGSCVLFSAAVPGQGGENHVNEQTHEYWRGLFEAVSGVRALRCRTAGNCGLRSQVESPSTHTTRCVNTCTKTDCASSRTRPPHAGAAWHADRQRRVRVVPSANRSAALPSCAGWLLRTATQSRNLSDPRWAGRHLTRGRARPASSRSWCPVTTRTPRSRKPRRPCSACWTRSVAPARSRRESSIYFVDDVIRRTDEPSLNSWQRASRAMCHGISRGTTVTSTPSFVRLF